MTNDNDTLHNLNSKACYAAFKAHDVRFDGRIFVCVASTGIYCRPVCRVRMPKEANCTFRSSAAAAEAEGFRPCRKCRPELAPGFSPVDMSMSLARRAARILDDDGLREDNLAALAGIMGVSDRHLRRAFAGEFGVSPVQYMQTKRLLLAKSLLTDTALPVTEIAFASGFGSIRRFNDIFQKRYRMSPTALRQRGAGDTEGGVTLYLGYRPPYDWDGILAFLAPRCIAGVEHCADGAYARTAAVGDHRGWIRVSHAPRKNALAVSVDPELLPVLATVLAKVRHQFDLDCDPAAIHETLAAMNTLRPGLAAMGTRLPGCFDPFEMSVRAILGQQITVKAARTLAARFAATFGSPLATPFPELTHTFPSPESVRQLEGPVESHLGPLGIIRTRARSILALAEALAGGTLRLAPGSDAEEEMRRLLALPGFGPWTVHYIAMRALGHPDAFPHGDYGVKKALAGCSPKEILEMAEAWRPWRAYATVNLWNSLQGA